MTEGPDHRLERLIFFSDAVIAIAITLLVIEIHPPHLESRDPRVAWETLAHLWPSFFGFALSFAVIGRFWYGHHSALAGMRGFDSRLLLPNMALLMCIAFTPFATAFMAANMGGMVPAFFYNATLLATALASARVVWIATSPARGHSRHTPGERREIRTRATLVVFAAAVAVIAAPFAPPFSQLPLLLVPLWRLFVPRRPQETQ